MGWFSKSGKTGKKEDYSILGTDIHSHLIPGIDDGARTTQEAIDIIKALMSLGFRKIITTPHVMSDNHPNNSEIIRDGLFNLKTALANENITIPVEAAAEYYVDFEFSDVLDKTELLTFGDKYILVEIPLNYQPNNLESVFFELQSKGLKPVLAHPERYSFWYSDMNNYTKLADREVLLQVNIHSFAFESGNPIRKMAEKLVSNQLVSFLGTDTHRMNNIELLSSALSNKYLTELLDSGRLLNCKL